MELRHRWSRVMRRHARRRMRSDRAPTSRRARGSTLQLLRPAGQAVGRSRTLICHVARTADCGRARAGTGRRWPRTRVCRSRRPTTRRCARGSRRRRNAPTCAGRGAVRVPARTAWASSVSPLGERRVERPRSREADPMDIASPDHRDRRAPWHRRLRRVPVRVSRVWSRMPIRVRPSGVEQAGPHGLRRLVERQPDRRRLPSQRSAIHLDGVEGKGQLIPVGRQHRVDEAVVAVDAGAGC
jgi:hypothetical protein